ncbi:pyridoxamine 5'-phosphate oxidase family protein [Haladaptatus sp. DYSN1]|uniref:pyridoxamine 5'-phosphate oxidase family protein n=1 Tax=unclassified Haladaptatus TaxID=2622732 RepID=UPI0024070E85|nr:pyridoxamine 5'-phosphate oxidase family protein [Haladaptatus sp. DYSN1]
MSDTHSSVMGDAEIEAFLDRGGSGVLALARDADSYAIPISYGFDPATTRFYFRLGYGPESQKRAYVEDTETARLVVYDEVDGEWRSVIAAGRLREIADDELNLEVVRALRQADLPLLDIFETPTEDLVFSMYVLDTVELTGRKSARPHSI